MYSILVSKEKNTTVFDTTDYQIIYDKSELYGIQMGYENWLRSFYS